MTASFAQLCRDVAIGQGNIAHQAIDAAEQVLSVLTLLVETYRTTGAISDGDLSTVNKLAPAIQQHLANARSEVMSARKRLE